MDNDNILIKLFFNGIMTIAIYSAGRNNYILMAPIVGVIEIGKRSEKYNYEITNCQKKKRRIKKCPISPH